MTAPPTSPLDDEDVALAAEYVLGVLDPAARREAEARMAREPAFASEVRIWTERLTPLAEEAPDTAPPPGLWPGIAGRLDEPLRPANDNAHALRTWRRIALGASGLAAASLAAVAVLLARPADPSAQVAALCTAGGVTALVVAFDANTGALLVTPGPGLQAAGHTPHLWLVNPDGRVQLVGAVDASHAATHNLPPALSRRAGAARGVALSLEPAGHKPIDAPGGPVVARGDFTEL